MLRIILLTAGLAASSAASAVQYPDFSDITGLQVNGAATVKFGSVLQMTPSKRNRRGSFFTDFGVDTSAFSTFFTFRVRGSGGTVPDCDDQVGGEGLSFVLQGDSSNALGTDGGGMGYEGIGTSFGVEFDTYCNADRNDPSTNHIALVANGINSHDGSLPIVNIKRRFDSGVLQYVWIDYDGTTLEVRLARGPNRPELPTLSHVIDIPATVGGPICCAGFTSATGESFGSVRIQEWEYIETDDDDDLGGGTALSSASAALDPYDKAAPKLVCRNRVANLPPPAKRLAPL